MGNSGSSVVPGVVRRKPLQTLKLVGVTLAVVGGVGGFLRLFDAGTVAGSRLLGDGQFLALVLVPLVSVALVAVVFVETLVAGYRVLRADRSLRRQIGGRVGYALVRLGEATVAVVGVAVVAAAVPVLFADATPAPAGVGVLLLLFAVGLAILVASFCRAVAELFVFPHAG